MLRELQERLKVLWKDDIYTREFRESPSKYKDFQHALLHVTKAVGKLAAMVEDLDHQERPAFSSADARKYISDVIICAVRMGNTVPGGEVDVQDAVIKRLEAKMGPFKED